MKETIIKSWYGLNTNKPIPAAPGEYTRIYLNTCSKCKKSKYSKKSQKELDLRSRDSSEYICSPCWYKVLKNENAGKRNGICKKCNSEFDTKGKRKTCPKCIEESRMSGKHQRSSCDKRKVCKIHFGRCISCGSARVSRNGRVVINFKCFSCRDRGANLKTLSNSTISKECEKCGSIFIGRLQRRQCDACRDKPKKGPCKAMYGAHLMGTSINKMCVRCGQDTEHRFTLSSGKSHKCQCHCIACKAKASKGRIGLGIGTHKKRAERYGVKYEPINVRYVYNRDEWTCYLCGINVKTYNHRKYMKDRASIDHVVPISKGGDHTYSNVMTCCVACNIRKGSRSTPGVPTLLETSLPTSPALV